MLEICYDEDYNLHEKEVGAYFMDNYVVKCLRNIDTEKMTEAARILLNLEGIGIDINMGCSAPDIYKHQAGIGWMLKDKNETAKMVRSVAEQVHSYNSQHENKKRFSILKNALAC